MDVFKLVKTLEASVAVDIVAVAEIAIFGPPKAKLCALTVMTDEPLTLARALILTPPVLIMLVPTNSAFETVLAIASRRTMKSSASAVRLDVSSERSDAASTFSFI